ncbi:MAG: hypothetical protein ABI725_01580 [Chloroflexota bacterium]
MDESRSARLSRWITAAVSHVQAEDLTMAAVLIVTPFLAPITSLLPIFGSDNDFLGGLIAFLAAVGAIAAMATRVPDENRLEKPTEDPVPVRMWLVGPFIGAVGFVAGDSLDRMGLPGGSALIGIAFLVTMVSFVFARRLPVVSRGTRRLLVAPFVLLSAAFLQQLAADFASAFAGTDLLGQLVGLKNLALVIQLFAILGFAALIFYEMLVFAPRELADPGASTRAWAVRFAIFYVSLVIAMCVGNSAPLLLA